MDERHISGLHAPAPTPLLLRAGPLTALFDPAEGDLRTICVGEREVVRRIYAAVRDQNWGTVPATLHDVQTNVQADQFTISYTAHHAAPGISYRWRGTICGTPDGTLTFDFAGVAECDFQRNRIGFCILHPSEQANSACTVLHVDGSSETATFPEYLVANQPVPPFAELRALHFAVTPACDAELVLEGDTFEMEDQRNWTDASFKTFCTPLRLPYPVSVSAGDTITQRITLRLHGTPPAAITTATTTALVTPQPGPSVPLPAFGLSVAPNIELDTATHTRLRALRPAYLRATVRLYEPHWRSTLKHAATQASALDCALEIALFTTGATDEITFLMTAIVELRVPVARWLVFSVHEQSTPSVLLATVAPHLAKTAPVFGGTDTDCIFLTRTPPDPQHVAGLTFAINPQVHAFDNVSLLETCAAQAQAVASVQRLAAGGSVVVGPLTLKPRYNPYAVAPPTPPAPSELPADVDIRQLALIGAVWTLGSLQALTAAGATAATWFETVGMRGVLASPDQSAHAQFPATPGHVYPLYHVLREVGAPAARALPYTSSDPLVFVLALQDSSGTRLLLGNASASVRNVAINGVPDAVHVRMLNVHTYEHACGDPETFAHTPGDAITTVAGALTLTLAPYAVARVS